MILNLLNLKNQLELFDERCSYCKGRGRYESHDGFNITCRKCGSCEGSGKKVDELRKCIKNIDRQLQELKYKEDLLNYKDFEKNRKDLESLKESHLKEIEEGYISIKNKEKRI